MKRKWLVIPIFLIMVGVAFASFVGNLSKWGITCNGLTVSISLPFRALSTGTFTGNVLPAVAGTPSIGTAALYFGPVHTLGIGFPRVDVSKTSPSVAIATGGGSYVNVQSDANQTAHYLTGGVLNRIVIVKSGSGSNTLRFDDGVSSMTLGGNVTLTEGQDDTLVLICTSADGDEWAKIGGNDN